MFSGWLTTRGTGLCCNVFLSALAICLITGTETELPNCLYACVVETGISNQSGNPCIFFH
jgi:hypothetical protein